MSENRPASAGDEDVRSPVEGDTWQSSRGIMRVDHVVACERGAVFVVVTTAEFVDIDTFLDRLADEGWSKVVAP